ncbi:MAG: flagellar assembly protein FliH [Pseudomonadota bacterium]|nr:flagellar assembly protein FliH [Pseudomonadota bacterium]
MSRVIPKEQLTAYQRWELGSIDPVLGEPLPKQVEASPAEPEPELVLSVPLPTAADLERIQQEAWQEGHDLGFAEGRKAGYEDGYKTGEDAAAKLRQLAEALQVESLRQDEAIAREVLELALNIAQQMLRATIQANPKSILVVIREALQSLPTLSGHHKVVVHPEDVAVVHEWLAKEHGHLSWKVVEDAQLSRGGFRFESAHSELDASLGTRWREITACLGTDTTWMG